MARQAQAGPLELFCGKSDDRLGIGGWRVAATAASCGCRAATGAAGAWRRPAGARGSVLYHARVGADDVATEVLRTGVAKVLAVLQRGVVHLDDRVLVARIVLRPAGEAGQIVVAQDDDVHAGGGGDFLGVGHALER